VVLRDHLKAAQGPVVVVDVLERWNLSNTSAQGFHLPLAMTKVKVLGLMRKYETRRARVFSE
jgi:hypothetical protein